MKYQVRKIFILKILFKIKFFRQSICVNFSICQTKYQIPVVLFITWLIKLVKKVTCKTWIILRLAFKLFLIFKLVNLEEPALQKKKRVSLNHQPLLLTDGSNIEIENSDSNHEFSQIHHETVKKHKSVFQDDEFILLGSHDKFFSTYNIPYRLRSLNKNIDFDVKNYTVSNDHNLNSNDKSVILNKNPKSTSKIFKKANNIPSKQVTLILKTVK